jgi:tetratricopeptide (TPR) repeat protein
MNVKKTLLTLILTGFMSVQLSASANEPSLKGLTMKYNAKNYVGCIQEADYIIKEDPSNGFAYYYQGISYAKLGKKDKATEAFEKVKTLNTTETLTNYATRALTCLTNADECKKLSESGNGLEEFLKSKKFLDKAVQTEVNKKKLERLKDSINDDLGPKKSEMPTNDEIAEAVKTLAKLGMNPLNTNIGMYQNPEMMQMSMLLGNNNNQQMNMLPLMMMGGNQNISPEIIQTMMMGQMNTDFSSNTY